MPNKQYNRGAAFERLESEVTQLKQEYRDMISMIGAIATVIHDRVEVRRGDGKLTRIFDIVDAALEAAADVRDTDE